MPDTAKKNSTMVVTIIAAIVCLGAGIAIGRYLLPNKPTSNDQFAARMGDRQFGGQGGQFAQGARGARAGGGQNGGFVNGELLKKDATSLSVKQRDGSTKLILVTSSTKALKMTEGTIGDINVGQQVMVTGSTNSDGSITAQTVQVRPEGLTGGPVPGAQPPTGQPAPVQP
jgi:hypothetical protein